ncbi:hypothetical protein M2132_002244 [Dysgonomonas sp. PH5-45]|nr:hypothetical protein [Dysgonomonas sp. PH5-45]MDH6388798.1 hypothetical protein [Dysgonomonas sp. PH5-37]
MVSAFCHSNGVSLAQVRTHEKSNEITAIPELLRVLDLEGYIVSIDAMGCQQDIANRITKQKADYLLAVKNNQPPLFLPLEDTSPLQPLFCPKIAGQNIILPQRLQLRRFSLTNTQEINPLKNSSRFNPTKKSSTVNIKNSMAMYSLSQKNCKLTVKK